MQLCAAFTMRLRTTALDSYSYSARFESGPSLRPFVVFLVLSGKCRDTTSIMPRLLFQNPFLINLLSYHSPLYSQPNDSAVEQPTKLSLKQVSLRVS
jgi:hypothetical protein